MDMSPQPSSPLHRHSSNPRLAAEGYENRIDKTVLCGKCGYNLKGLPYVANCVECNASYNARRVMSTTIYRPGTTAFPWTPLIGLVVLALMALALAPMVFSLGRFALAPVVNISLFLLIVSAFGAVLTGAYFLREFLPYRRHRMWERIHAESIADDASGRRTRDDDEGTFSVIGSVLKSPPHSRDRFDEFGYETTINWPAICTKCGYTLRGLPFVGTCPECGSQYCARLMKLQNVATPYGAAIPWGDIWGGVLSAVIAGLLGVSFSNNGAVGLLVMALAFGAGALAFGVIARRKWQRYVLVRRAVSDMEEETEDD